MYFIKILKSRKLIYCASCCIYSKLKQTALQIAQFLHSRWLQLHISIKSLKNQTKFCYQKIFAIISIAIPIVHNDVNSLDKHAWKFSMFADGCTSNSILQILETLKKYFPICSSLWSQKNKSLFQSQREIFCSSAL